MNQFSKFLVALKIAKTYWQGGQKGILASAVGWKSVKGFKYHKKKRNAKRNETSFIEKSSYFTTLINIFINLVG